MFTKVFRPDTGKHNLRFSRRLEETRKGIGWGQRVRAARWLFLLQPLSRPKNESVQDHEKPERFISGGLFRTVFEKSLVPKLFQPKE